MTDCFDLNDWILANYPELHRATFYLPVSAQMSVWEQVWVKAGSPDISAINA